MSKLIRGSFKVLDLLIIFVMVFGSPMTAFAAPSPTGATIASDLADYNPGGQVTLTGAGWAPGEAVHIVVNDTVGQTWQRVTDVTADTLGNFTDIFNLPNYFVSDYDVTASGSTSGSATTAFTDANPSATLDQCANDPSPSPSTDGCSASASDWINGNMGASKSVYFEGDSLPYRLTFDNLSLASHTVTIEWDTTKSSTHALDYLTTYNRTVGTANPCLGVSGCNPGTFTTFAIPADPQVTGAGVTPVAGNFTLFGGTITSVSAYSYADGAGFAGDKSARISITFTPSVANPVLAWAGHISSRADWGANNSAVAIPGSPYHTRLIDLDGAGGNQDRSLSADAVIFPGSITIIKDATPNGSTSFGFTGSPSPLTNFSLVDDGTSANTKVFSNITTFTTYTVNEISIPAGWGFDSVSCGVTTPNGGSYSTSTTTVNISMAEGENWTCTYLDSQRTGSLTVIKHVVNDNGGTATADQWSIHVKSGATEVSGSPQAGSESGTSYTLNAGTYNVSETGGVSGYTFDGFSGDCDSSGNVTVVVGQTKTCTLTNNDQTAHLKLVKTVTNDNGGTAVATDFTLSASGPTPISGAGGAESDVNAGTYTLGETNLPGYTAGSWSCSGGTFTAPDKIAVALGQSATCTINNNDNSSHLKLVKTVTNDNGGTAVATDFTLSAAGPTPISGAGGAESDVNAGSYTLSETTLAGYTAGSWSCVGGTQNGASVTLALGESATCTINNNDQSAHLTLIKYLTNDNGGTAVVTDFTLSAAGPTPISGPGGVSSDVNAGTYSLSESGPANYDKGSWSCAGGTFDGTSQVTLALGESATCSVTNNDKTAHLKLVKTVTNDNGGTAVAADFTLSANGPTPISGAGGVDSDVNAGSYTLSETTLPGYTAGAWSCSGGTFDGTNKITLANGESATCTINNNDQTAHLKLVKVVVNDNGGTAVVTDFTLSAAGPTPLSGAGGAESDVNAGTYNLSETGPAGYSTTGYDCGTSVTLSLGESKTCTITNDDKAAHLTLVKVVVNDNGGTAGATDFTLSANGPTPISGAGGVSSNVNAGTYNLSETGPAGYSTTGYDCGPSVTLALGESKTCTITNNDIAPKLHLRKVVVNDNGGTATVADFTLTANGAGSNDLLGTSPVDSDGTLKADTWALSETGPAGYSAGAWSCVGGTQNGSNITVSIGGEATCTITNNDIAPKLHLRKVVINNNGGTATVASFPLTADGTASNDLSGTSPVDSGAGLQADTWALSETGPAGYSASAWSCVGGTQNGSNITVGIGGEATCTITNDDIAPKLHLRKVVVNDNGGTKTVADFTLTANGTGSNDLSGTSPVDSGAGLQADTWALSENTVYGYTASAWSCVGGTQNGSNITVGIGGEATCTITNNDLPGTIVIIKNAKPAQGSFAFTTTGTGYNGFTLTGSTSGGGNVNTQSLNAGTYTVKEATQLGWTLTGIGGSADPNTPYACVVTGSGGSTGSGDLNTQTASISLKNGDTVTCTFENTGNGATRTQGFWATHPQLAQIAWDGGTAFGHTFPGVAATTGIGDQLICGRPVDSQMLAGQNELMGGFWADVSKTSTGTKRSALDQARMQLLQQLLAAELNASAFGSVPSGGTGMFATWESALCGTNQTAIKNAQQQAASFNTNGDSSTFTPGTSADSKNARLYANIPFWNIIKP